MTAGYAGQGLFPMLLRSLYEATGSSLGGRACSQASCMQLVSPIVVGSPKGKACSLSGQLNGWTAVNFRHTGEGDYPSLSSGQGSLWSLLWLSIERGRIRDALEKHLFRQVGLQGNPEVLALSPRSIQLLSLGKEGRNIYQYFYSWRNLHLYSRHFLNCCFSPVSELFIMLAL